MAEGFLRHFGGDKFDVYSAGTNPTEINPDSIKVMGEVGIDIKSQESESVTKYLEKGFDYVITVCDNAKNTCPIFSGECSKLHWNLEDPAEATGTEVERMDFFRKTRNLIKERVEAFIVAFE